MVLYFTTFNQSLYNISGKSMIESFSNFKTINDRLIIFYEHHTPFDNCDSNINIMCVKQSSFYKKWFDENIDIIPQKHGGNCTNNAQCLKVGLSVKWNTKACLWFWKIVACYETLKYMKENPSEYEYIVLIDCDTEFKSKIDSEFWNSLLPENKHCGYHLGPFRSKASVHHCSGVESGIVIFRNTDTGRQIIENIITKYTSGTFRNEARWDDGYIIRTVVEKNKHCYDFSQNCNISDVISQGPFKDIIMHHKGKHRKFDYTQISEIDSASNNKL